MDTVPIEIMYAANADGYKVVALRHGAWIEDYTAGNCRAESTGHEPDPALAVPVWELTVWARSTARDFRRELRERFPVAPISIFEEPALLEE